MTDSQKRSLLPVENDEFMRHAAPDSLDTEGFHVLLMEYDVLTTSLQVAQQLTEMALTSGVVIFSAHKEHGQELLQFVSQGVRGIAYILKGQPAGDLLHALRSALTGEAHFAPKVRINTRTPAEAFLQLCTLPEERAWIERGLTCFDTLTKREFEIARLLASSHTTPAVAKTLCIEPKTAETHIRNIYAKLGLDAMDDQAPHLNARSIFVKICNLYELQDNHREP
jgi:DNA-binding NarL/FixJ family response regulator